MARTQPRARNDAGPDGVAVADVKKAGNAAQIPVLHIWRYQGDEIKRLQILTDTHQNAELLGMA